MISLFIFLKGIKSLPQNQILLLHISLQLESRVSSEEEQLFNFNNLFLDKGCGHKLTHTNKNEISINLFPVCYRSLFIILFCSRLVKSRTPQRFVLCHCLKNLTMGNPVNHSEHLFCAGWSCFLFFLRLNYLVWLIIWLLITAWSVDLPVTCRKLDFQT